MTKYNKNIFPINLNLDIKGLEPSATLAINDIVDNRLQNQ